MKGTLGEDVARTKKGSRAVIGGDFLNKNSTFFSGKRRSVVVFLMMMVYILTPVEGGVIRPMVDDEGAGWANWGRNHNQWLERKLDYDYDYDNNNKEIKWGQNNGQRIVDVVTRAAEVVTKAVVETVVEAVIDVVDIARRIGRILTPKPQKQEDEFQKQEDRPQGQWGVRIVEQRFF
jgi:hypothetical protein